MHIIPQMKQVPDRIAAIMVTLSNLLTDNCMCKFAMIKDAVNVVSLTMSDKLCAQGSQLSILMLLAEMTSCVPSYPIPGHLNDPHPDFC